MTIEKIIAEHGTYIYRFALKLTCHPADAEDLCQETFTAAWQKLSDLHNEAAVKGWLRTICLNRFLMNSRKKNPDVDFSADIDSLEKDGKQLRTVLPSPEEEVVVAEHIKRMQDGCFYAMVRRLTLPQRTAFSLVDMFGLSIEECADMLCLSSGAVKGLLFRARMNLDAFFSGHCNLLDEKNPCSCQAWITFRQTHTDNQIKMRTNIDFLDYQKRNYIFNETTRAKIHFLYSHMAETKPDDGWYQKVIDAVKK